MTNLWSSPTRTPRIATTSRMGELGSNWLTVAVRIPIRIVQAGLPLLGRGSPIRLWMGEGVF